MRSFELWVGLRYTRAKRRNHFISFISGISMAGIALGVAALIVVLSVMNGFQDELRARILGVVAHAEITGPRNALPDWEAVARDVARHPRVVASAPFVAGQGLFSYDGRVQGGIVRGVLPEYEDRVAEIGQKMKIGRLVDLKPGEFGVILGRELAGSLNVTVGEKVVLITPQGNVTPAGLMPRLKQFTVVGIFAVGMYEYDAGLALIHLEDAKKLYRLGDQVSGLRLKLDDMYAAPQVVRDLAKTLTGEFFLGDWTKSHVNFFRAVQIEKRVMFVILTLIIGVAVFNIVSTLVMVVTDKQPDIAILRTLGASPRSVMKVFMVQGSLIGLIGTALGVAVGLVLAFNVETVVPWVERIVGFDLFPADVYYISLLPSRVDWNDVLLIAGVALALGFVSTLYPAWRASRVNPAEALRYE